MDNKRKRGQRGRELRWVNPRKGKENVLRESTNRAGEKFKEGGRGEKLNKLNIREHRGRGRRQADPGCVKKS